MLAAAVKGVISVNPSLLKKTVSEKSPAMQVYILKN